MIMMFLTGASGPGQVEIEGSLGGLQLLDLSMDDVYRRSLQTVFSVGLDPAASSTHHMAHFRPPDNLMYKTANESFLVAPGEKAFNFRMSRGPDMRSKSSFSRVPRSDGC